MYPFFPIHALAAARGDGLRPELIRMFTARAAVSSPMIVQLGERSDGFEQAGPNPVGDSEASLPEGVLQFPARAAKSKHV